MTLPTNWGNDVLNAYAKQINTLEAQAKTAGASSPSYDKSLEDWFNQIKDQVLGSSNGGGGKGASGSNGTAGSNGKTASSGKAGGSGGSTGNSPPVRTSDNDDVTGPDPTTLAQMAALTKISQQQQANQFYVTGEKSKNDTNHDISKLRVG